MPSSFQNATVALVDAGSLTAGSASAPMPVPRSGRYGWAYQFTGTGPLALQVVGPDNATWQTIGSVSASGSGVAEIFAGASGTRVRLLNAGPDTLTNLYARLDS
jgi:hypothetical protein